MISGCNEVTTPDDRWITGIKFSEDIGMSLENKMDVTLQCE
jgi:hypothetical protein